VFDYLTFAVLFWLNATVMQFRTGWFIESIVSASLIVLVIRTRHRMWRTRPSRLLVGATIGVICIAIAIPHSPVAKLLGLCAMPAHFYPIIAAIITGYVFTAEVAKRIFYRKATING
jgi:Mg2+-importing ATPase